MKKKHIFLFVLFALIPLLFGCAGTKQPSNSSIKKEVREIVSEDIQEDYEFPLNISKINILSIEETDDDICNVEAEIYVKAKYATLCFPVYMLYSKDDNTWLCELCSWDDPVCKISKYPNQTQINQMIEELNVPNASNGEVTYEEDKIVYTVDTGADWSKYASGYTTGIYTWVYNGYYDDWKHISTEGTNASITLTKELEGQWALYNNDGYMFISNVTPTSLDVAVSSSFYNLPQTHFTPTQMEINNNYDGCMSITFAIDSTFRQLTFTIHLPKGEIPAGLTTANLKMQLSDYSIGGNYAAVVLDESSKIQ